MKLDKSPFVIISVIGQELLAAGYHASSLVVLESALKIGKIQRNNGWTFGDIDQAKYRGGKRRGKKGTLQKIWKYLAF